ncbi:F0F1 ATP synthase subunit delta [Paenalkalicoccus suaedae]|uniref:ATP synthase subunit delta n=1 Tax=Paenalkalicoccus suaedae TaxID=2592382 RepID=A0A859FIN0_9BACI|nr:F0F1 ATP synthase subunit delta [Paenalkalicoccus suaedae]QKS72750.1 F0F1 ATP synthase subunit delta [Paenalkalicoccus suaedae]
MRRDPIGFRYASALFDLTREQNSLDQTLEELKAVQTAMTDTNLLDEVFRHPKMTDEQKKSIIKDAFSGKVSTPVVNLLQLLIDNKRESLFTSIVESYQTLTYEQQGIAEATVYTAKELTEEEKEAIAVTFARRASKAKLFIHNVVDKDVIGGIKVRIGDTVYDGTVANQLERIHSRMVAGNVSR